MPWPPRKFCRRFLIRKKPHNLFRSTYENKRKNDNYAVVCCFVICNYAYFWMCEPCIYWCGDKRQSSITPKWIYVVLGEGSTPEQARVEGVQYVILTYDRKKYTDTDQNEPLYYAAIDPCSYVPLVIEGKPQVQKDGRGKGVLLVSLKRENAKKLEDFTRDTSETESRRLSMARLSQ